MAHSTPAASEAQRIDFGLDSSPETGFLAGPAFHEEMAKLRAAHRLAPILFNGAPSMLVTRFDDLDTAFRDQRGELPAGPTYQHSVEPAQGVTFESLDGPEHHLLRRLTTADLRSRPVSRYVQRAVPQIASELIDRFADAGEADLVAQLTSQLPFLVFADKLGIPVDAAELFMGWAFGIMSYPVDPDLALATAAEFTEYVRPVLESRRRQPTDDLLSAMCTAEEGGRRLDDEEILAHARALFAPGASTTFHGLGNTLYAMLTHPAAMDRLRAEPDLVPDVVSEMLRWEAPLGMLPRLATFDAELCDQVVPAGTLLLFGLASANRDPAVFGEPDRFDPDRRPQRIFTFGFGDHHCPGSHLARHQIAVAIRVLLERLDDLRLVDVEDEAARPAGSVFRGPRALRVAFRAQ
jgi:cytochrome P450